MYRQTLLIIFSTIMIISCGGGNGTPDPEITGLQPTSGPPGTMVTIFGKGFAPEASGNEVSFAGTVAQVVLASESELEVTVPEGASSGAVSVRVGEMTARGPGFNVEPRAPIITSVDPQSGSIGTEVTINGDNFSTSAPSNIIMFNGVESQVIGAATEQLITEVPEGAKDGPIQVTVQGRSATGPDFDVLSELYDRVVFINSSVSPEQVYSMNPDGSDLKLLFEKNGFRNFDISPDGTQIVFSQGGSSVADLIIVNSDGTNEIALSENNNGYNDPAWSPDGTRIAFSGDDSGGENEIFVINTDGSNLQQLTDQGYNLREPHWSPDGSRIVFDAFPDDNYEIGIMDADGSNMNFLTNDTSGGLNTRDQDPVWSPDGSRIAFASTRNGSFDIYTMNPDGSGVVQVTSITGDIRNPVWSPDGTHLAADGLAGSNYEIYKLKADGSGSPANLTMDNQDQQAPQWGSN